MIDWIRKRIIIEKNAERQPKKSGGARAGEGVRAGGREIGEKRRSEGKRRCANYWE